MSEFKIRSGMSKGINKEAIVNIRKWLDSLIHALMEMQRLSTSLERTEIVHMDPKLDTINQEMRVHIGHSVRLEKKIADYRKQTMTEAGIGQVLDDPKIILALLPPHRVTSRQEEPGLGIWRIAFKHTQFPALAKLAGLSYNQVWQAVCNDPEVRTVAQTLQSCFEPLTNKGFNIEVEIVEVTKTNVLCKVKAESYQG